MRDHRELGAELLDLCHYAALIERIRDKSGDNVQNNQPCRSSRAGITAVAAVSSAVATSAAGAEVYIASEYA